MGKQSAEAIIKSYQKRTTPKRVALLEFLMDNSKAYTLSEIENLLPVSMDRVTVYRILQVFEEIGLVMKMVDSKGICMYMLNLEDHRTLHLHPHLHCTKCDKVLCLPCLPKEYLEGLEKYEIAEMYFLMEGICPDCLKQNNSAHDTGKRSTK